MSDKVKKQGEIGSTTNVNKCADCPFNPFRGEEEADYTSANGKPVEQPKVGEPYGCSREYVKGLEAEIDRLTAELAEKGWKKQIPNAVGYWLRVNAGHRVQLHKIFELDGELMLIWGWGGNEVPCVVEQIREKLKSFYWCGPLPEPPKEAL